MAASGDLIIEINKDVTANPLHTTLESLESLKATFLGADEPTPTWSELEEHRQQGGNKSENQILPYCRLFTHKDDEAYRVVNQALETEAKLAELFVTSLIIEEVAREIFENDQWLRRIRNWLSIPA